MLDVSYGKRRVAEGAAMLRTKGEAGTGNVVEAVRHARAVQREIKMVSPGDLGQMDMGMGHGAWCGLVTEVTPDASALPP